ncbi:unnamed protein product [marine sediment metagenome]|uniref:Uncharacterized protein n=1 Tax=marine sediment metagenome TaxID=412755 RepID=X0T6H5_9ZZZZ
MTKDFYHALQFADPSGQQTPAEFCDTVLGAYGSRRMPVLFSMDIFPRINMPPGYDATGPIDERKFRHKLSHGDNDDTIPQGSEVWLDIESPEWAVFYHPPEAPNWYSAHQQGIDWRHGLLDIAEQERPDCTFGFYGQVPHVPFRGTLHPDPQVQQWREELAVACHPLARRVFLLPYFYHNKRQDGCDTFEDRLRWIRSGLTDARRFFPESRLIGMTWMEWYDLWKVRPIPDTPEAQTARLLSGWQWWKINQAILDLADGVLWWGGRPPGTNTWQPQAEWVDASGELFRAYGNN